MKANEIDKIKVQYDNLTAVYNPPVKIIDGGKYSFFFRHKVNPLASTWIECDTESELAWVHDYFYGILA